MKQSYYYFNFVSQLSCVERQSFWFSGVLGGFFFFWFFFLCATICLCPKSAPKAPGIFTSILSPPKHTLQSQLSSFRFCFFFKLKSYPSSKENAFGFGKISGVPFPQTPWKNKVKLLHGNKI